MKALLVKIDVVACVLEKSAKQVLDLVDGGIVSEPGLLWVFNLAINPAGYRRDLRFWWPEVKARAAGQATQYQRQSLDWVISQIVSDKRETFYAGEINDLFQVRHPTRLGYGGQLPGHRATCGNTYQRPALERFLRRRWIGAGLVEGSQQTAPNQPLAAFAADASGALRAPESGPGDRTGLFKSFKPHCGQNSGVVSTRKTGSKAASGTSPDTIPGGNLCRPGVSRTTGGLANV